jgi:hypothetical protein
MRRVLVNESAQRLLSKRFELIRQAEPWVRYPNA